MAVGRILANGEQCSDLQAKGKAVEVAHFLYDELWNSGPKKVPEGIKMVSE